MMQPLRTMPFISCSNADPKLILSHLTANVFVLSMILYWENCTKTIWLRKSRWSVSISVSLYLHGSGAKYCVVMEFRLTT